MIEQAFLTAIVGTILFFGFVFFAAASFLEDWPMQLYTIPAGLALVCTCVLALMAIWS